jgi:hypothetical protein
MACPLRGVLLLEKGYASRKTELINGKLGKTGQV